MPLRPYQGEATQAIDKALLEEINRQLLVMATGTGKTEVFSHLPEILKHRLPGQQMVLLHRDELAQQAIKKVQKRLPHLNVQQEAGTEHCDPCTADYIVASVQTLGRKGTKRLDKFNRDTLDKFVVDEAHRSIADSYYNVYNHFDLLRDKDPRLLLGVTATPTRGDGEGLGKLYQKIVYTYSLRQAIEDGYLVDVRGIRVDTETSLDEVSTKGGDFDTGELADAVDNPYRNLLVAKAYIENCMGRQAIGFGVNIAHAQHLAETFKAQGLNAEAVWGADPDRDEKVQRFRDGEIDILFNAQLLVEGFDLSTIGCVILAAPTKSGVVFSQRVGRGTRLDLPDGFDNLHVYREHMGFSPQGLKEDCIVLDVCDSTSRHSLVTLPTLLGLPSGLNMRGRSLIATAKAIEEQIAKYPHLDFSSLKDADKVEAFVESVNLFEVKFPSEIRAGSEFSWHPTITGGYVLMLPEKDELRIEQNLLDKWDIKGHIKGKKYKGERDTLEAALSAADGVVLKVSPEALKIVKREAPWHSLPPTPAQLKSLGRLYKGKQIPPDLSRGTASQLIGAALAGK